MGHNLWQEFLVWCAAIGAVESVSGTLRILRGRYRSMQETRAVRVLRGEIDRMARDAALRNKEIGTLTANIREQEDQIARQRAMLVTAATKLKGLQ